MLPAFSFDLDDLVIEFLAGIDGNEALVLQFIAELPDFLVILITQLTVPLL